MIFNLNNVIRFNWEVGLKQPSLKKASKLPINKCVRFENYCDKKSLKLRNKLIGSKRRIFR